jgi:hypothetical protein
MQDPTPNPALKEPELLVGDWNLEIDLPSDLPTAARGHVSFEWLEGGAFLVMRVGVEWEAPSGSVAIIGHDDASETYSTLYFDARGASRIYQMTLNDDV